MPAITLASASHMVIGMATGAEQAQVTKYGYDKPVPDVYGERILEYALAYDLLLYNMCLKKRNSHLITDRSGNTACVISKGPVTDVMVISGEGVALQPSAGKRHVD